MIDIKRQEEAFGKLNRRRKKKQLQDIAKINMGQSPSSADYNELNIGKPLIQGNADIIKRKTVPRIYSASGSRECNEGTIIMSVRAPVGTVAKSTGNYFIGRGVAEIDSNLNEYIYQYLLWHENRWGVLSTGSTFESVDSKSIKELNVQMHWCPEAIANFLLSLDELIQKQEEYIEELKVQKNGYSQSIFNQKFRFNGSKNECTVGHLKDIAEVVGGYAFKSKDLANEGLFPVIKIGNIKSYINKTTHTGAYTNLEVNSNFKVGYNDIIIALSGATFGKVGIVNEIDSIMYLNQRTAKVSSKENQQDFINGLLKNVKFKKYIDSIPTQSAQPNISNSDIEKFKVLIPSLEEQEIIGTFLRVMDERIELQEKKLEQLKLKKKYYLNKIFA